MAKINPGKCIDYLPAVLVVLAVIYAGILDRLDVLVLSSGIGLTCIGLKVPVFNTLIIVAMATFLGSYLPFGGPNEMVIKRAAVNEHFANNNSQDGNTDANEDFEDESFEDEKETFEDGIEHFSEQKEEFEDEKETFEDEKETFEDEIEHFSEQKEEFEDEQFEDEQFDGKEEFEDEQFADKEEFEDENFDEDNFEGFANAAEKEKPKKKKKSKKVLPPNNGDRAEPLVLGKKYKIPSEDDDEDFHLDAGTTFLNAYKSLDPDQISAMTKDTQDLINTQKQLMSTLNTLKPLITDGKAMMQQFGGFLGGEGGSGVGMGDLSKLAEKFAGGAK
jgi:hypothetical protein